MSKLRVLVANEPRSYREALWCCLRHLRPNVEVLLVEPGALGRETGWGVASTLVLCSRITSSVQRNALAWVELYPEGKPLMVMRLDELRLKVIDADLPNLLWIVDQAELLAQKSRKPVRD